jgi:chromosome segregation ATPase
MEKLAAETGVLEHLEKERERVNLELDEAEKKDAINKYELSELERIHAELSNAKQELVSENASIVLPELDRLEGQLSSLQKEYERQAESLEKESRTKQALLERHETLEVELQQARGDLADARDRLIKAQAEPGRVRKQAESVHRAAEQLVLDIAELKTKIEHNQNTLEKQKQKRAEAEDQKAALDKKLAHNKAMYEKRQAEVAVLQRLLDLEKDKQHELITSKVELEINKRSRDEDLRRALEELSAAKKEYENKKRLVRKKRYVADGVRELIPTLAAQLLDYQHSLRAYNEENKETASQIEEAKKEVEVSIARFLKQETLDKGKREELVKLIESVAATETEVHQWQAEERKQMKLIALLAAQRELKARAATRASQEEKEVKMTLKVKELAVLDLTKKCNDVNNKFKEYTRLYEVVKNERNKYLSLISASSNALAEMKEKLNVLTAEVEILRGESLAKDKILAKEVSNHAMNKAARDSLRLELNKKQQEYRKKQEAVQSQIEDVRSLNSIINAHEREMLRLKRRYHDAVNKRNETGVNLIDKNDELCVLYEKSNLQASTLERGDKAVRSREDELRTLNLEFKEVERQLMVARKRVPEGGDMIQKAVALAEQLKEQRERTAKLCLELESPENLARFRELEGSDPDLPTLQAKISVLEARLDEKKSALLERELVLDEVTTLTQKLKNRAGDGRDTTLKLGAKVNDYQGRIRDVTRKMMATVSELSMYQATAMKLQEEKSKARNELEEAKWRVAHGKSPSEEAEREWFHMEQSKLAKQEAKYLEMSSTDNNGIYQSSTGMGLPTLAIRTTAEPRPNAYIPDEIGIPKPYGVLAPFKPSEPGTTMRHIRPPIAADIQI